VSLSLAFWRWIFIATPILLLLGRELLRRRLDDAISAVAALSVVLTGGLAVVVVSVLTLESAILSSSDVKAVTSPTSQGEVAVLLHTAGALPVGGAVLAMVGGRSAGRARDERGTSGL